MELLSDSRFTKLGGKISIEKVFIVNFSIVTMNVTKFGKLPLCDLSSMGTTHQ